jgi:hypothetical protein
MKNCVQKCFLLVFRQRQENAARAVERDRRHWESVQKTWHATTEADKAHMEMRVKVRANRVCKGFQQRNREGFESLLTIFEVAVKNGLNIKPNQHNQFLSKSVKYIVVNIIKIFYLRSKYLGRQKLFNRSILVVQTALVIREFAVDTFRQNTANNEGVLYCPKMAI